MEGAIAGAGTLGTAGGAALPVVAPIAAAETIAPVAAVETLAPPVIPEIVTPPELNLANTLEASQANPQAAILELAKEDIKPPEVSSPTSPETTLPTPPNVESPIADGSTPLTTPEWTSKSPPERILKSINQMEQNDTMRLDDVNEILELQKTSGKSLTEIKATAKAEFDRRNPPPIEAQTQSVPPTSEITPQDALRDLDNIRNNNAMRLDNNTLAEVNRRVANGENRDDVMDNMQAKLAGAAYIPPSEPTAETTPTPEPSTPETPIRPPEPSAEGLPSTSNVRAQELQAKVDDPAKREKMTPEEWKEFRDYKKSEKANLDREQRMINGEFSDEELEQYVKDKETQSAEKTIDQKVNDAGDKLAEAMVNGKDVEGALTEFTKLQLEKEGLGSITSDQLLKNAVKNLLNPDQSPLNKKSEKELLVQKRVQEKMRDMMGLEMQIMAAPQKLEMLKQEAEKEKQRLRDAETVLTSTSQTDSTATRQKRMQYYSSMQRLAALKGEAIKTQHAGEMLNFKLRDLRREVKGMLGMYKGLGGLLERVADWTVNRTAEGITLSMMDLESIYNFP